MTGSYSSYISIGNSIVFPVVIGPFYNPANGVVKAFKGTEGSEWDT